MRLKRKRILPFGRVQFTLATHSWLSPSFIFTKSTSTSFTFPGSISSELGAYLSPYGQTMTRRTEAFYYRDNYCTTIIHTSLALVSWRGKWYYVAFCLTEQTKLACLFKEENDLSTHRLSVVKPELVESN